MGVGPEIAAADSGDRIGRPRLPASSGPTRTTMSIAEAEPAGAIGGLGRPSSGSAPTISQPRPAATSTALR